MLKPLLIPDNLKRNHLLLLMVEAFNSLPKATTAKLVNNFKSIAEVITNHNVIVAAIVVIPIVILFAWGPTYFLCLLLANEVNKIVSLNLNLFIFRKILLWLDCCLAASHWKFIYSLADCGTWLLWIWRHNYSWVVIDLLCNYTLHLADCWGVFGLRRFVSEHLLVLNLLLQLLLKRYVLCRDNWLVSCILLNDNLCFLRARESLLMLKRKVSHGGIVN